MTPYYPSLPDGTKLCKRGHKYDAICLQCPECKRNNTRAYHDSHHAELLLYWRDHYKNNRDHVLKTKKSYAAKNGDTILAKKRERYAREWRVILKRQYDWNSLNPERALWRGMIARCTNRKSLSYKDYGGRGIKVCGRWLVFSNFLEDMGKRPSPKHSIERIDNDKGYSPANCKWATVKEQSRNRRSNRFLEFNGKKQCMEDWAIEIGVSAPVLQARIDKLGWSIERALTTGKRKRIWE